MDNAKLHIHKPVALLKIKRFGVLGGNSVKMPRVANARSAFFSSAGVNVGRGIGAVVSKTGEESIEDIQEGRAVRAKEKMVPKAR